MGISRIWIRIASFLVPREERREWVEEWVGELAATKGGMRNAWGALPDAWYLRTEGWTMEGFVRDVRMAVRALARKPFFTALAGVTLAVGIGANTAIFSVVDGVLINPLPYPGAERIVSANHTAPGLNLPVVPHSEGFYLHYQESLHSLEAFAVFSSPAVTLIGRGDPKRLSAAGVTQEFFDVMGVQPVLGRPFAPGEDREGAEPVAILSHGLWQQDFGGDPAVVGSLVDLSGVQRRIVGVMPRDFDFPGDAEIWLPLPIDETDPEVGNLGLMGVGRMRDGLSTAEVNAEMQESLWRYADLNPEEIPRSVLEEAGFVPDVKPLKELFVADAAQALWILLGTVGFVLLIACANVANLFLVRAEARQREQAVRTALGATRSDMTRQYLTESVTLAVGSGLLGLGLAHFGVQGLLALAPVTLPFSREIGIDGSVLAFTALISVGSGFLFGLFPAFGYARRDLSATLKEGGRASTDGRERHRVRSLLVVSQVALALVLLVGSGLMARSFMEVRNVDPGFDWDRRLTFRYSLPRAEYADDQEVLAFHRRVLERMATLPGVVDATLATALPLESHKNATPMEAVEDPIPDGQIGPLVNGRRVGPGYFRAMGIELLEGRELGWDDHGAETNGIVVSEALARTLWPGEASVLGRGIRAQDGERVWEVVGVARDVRFEELTLDPEPLAYFPLVGGGGEAVSTARSVAAVLVTEADPLGFVEPARSALREIGPRIPLVDPTTVARIYGDAMASTSFTVLLLGIASAIALILGTVGIYGVISYVVSRRTPEIGLRMALGAPAGLVLREVMGQGMVLTGWGIGIGLLGAWGVSRILASLLYGVSATDPLTFLGTAAGLAGVALLATWLPARRAARVDPLEALRSD